MTIKEIIIPQISVAEQTKVAKPVQKDIQPETTPENCTLTRKFEGNLSTGVYPRINKMSPEEKFEFRLHSGTKLKDGSTLIRPVIFSLGKVEIKRTDKGDYTITSSVAPKELSMTEEELKNTHWLSRGSIKQIEGDLYAVNYQDRDGESHCEEVNKQQAMQILEDNIYCM